MFVLRNLFFWIALVVIGATLAWLFFGQVQGEVVIRQGGYDHRATLAQATGLLLLGFVALWLLCWLLTLPLRSWRAHRTRQTQARLGDGFDALHQGHYERAGRLLEQAADEPEREAAARVAAAQAAWTQGDAAGARRLLDGFANRHPATRAIAMAELALAEERPTDALVALDAPAAQPLPPRGLALRAQALATSGQAIQAYELLGALRRQHALPEARLAAYERDWSAAALREAPDGNALADRWEALPKPLRTDPLVVAAYADHGARLGWDEAVSKRLEQAIEAHWDEDLVARYGALPLNRIDHRTVVCERWLRQQPGSPALLLALSRLAATQQQWVRAEDYAHRALELQGDRRGWTQLGDVWLAQGHADRAAQAYANALRASDAAPIAPPPRTPITLLSTDVSGVAPASAELQDDPPHPGGADTR